MRRSSRLILCVGLAASLLTAAAQAAPPVLDRLPTNAVAAISTPSLARLHKNTDAFFKAVDAPFPLPDLEGILAQLGIEANKGFDPQKGSVAVACVSPKPGPDGKMPEDPDPEQMVVLLFEATNYADFIANFEAKPGGAGGIDHGSLNGSDQFFKDLGGGFVAMAPAKDTLERADWKGDHAAHNAAIGPAARNVLDSADLSVIIFTAQARELLPAIQKAIDNEVGKFPNGKALEDFKDSPLAGMVADSLLTQSTSTVTGIRVDAQGIAVDSALSFDPASEIGKSLSGFKGSSRELFARLPKQPFYIAMAVDLSSPGVRRFIDDSAAKLADDQKNGLLGFVTNWLKNSDGAAVCIGAPPGGLMNGLFTSTISYVKTSNPDAFVENVKSGLATLNGTSAMGLTMETKFEPGAGKIEASGTPLDVWTIGLKSDVAEEDMGQAGMMLKMAFGATGGPNGYIARADGGILQTLGKNSSLISSALAVGKGGESLASDKMLAKVAEQLPKDRAIELYFGVKDLLETMAPFIPMNADVEISPSLPPFGIGIAGGESGARFGAYLPAQTLKTVMAFSKELQKAQMGNDGPEAGEGKKNGPKNGAGQPRF